MIELIRPERGHVLNPTYMVRWQSNRQPYVFKFTRKDAYCSFSNQGGYVLVTNNTQGSGVLDEQNIAIGDVITIVRGTTVNTGTVTAVGQSFELTTDIPWTLGLPSTGYLNWAKKISYKLFLKVYAYIPSTQQVEYLGEIVGTPDTAGIIKMDVRTLLEYKMYKRNKFGFNNVHELEYTGWNYFTIQYRNSYIEEGQQITDVNVTKEEEIVNGAKQPVRYYTVDGAKYLLTQYGQNYADYVPQRVTGIYANFLTLFSNPVYFIGYPFSLSFIWSTPIVGFNNTREEDELDTNGSIVNHNDANLGFKVSVGIHQLTLKGTYTSNVEQVDVWLESGNVASNNYVEDDYVQDNYTTQTPASVTPVYRITEKKRVLLNKDCRKNPIYLMWKNVLGGWDFWLFDKVNETSYVAKQNGTFVVDNEDIARGIYRERLLSANQVKRYLLGDVVSKEQADAIIQVEMSPQVFMLWDATKLATDPDLAWIGVTIAPKGVKYTSRQTDVELELQIELPEFYNVAN